MSVDFEQQLRESLRERSASPVLIHPDPLAAFTLRERRHRRVRRTRQGVVGLGSAVLVAAIALVMIALPNRPHAIEVGPAHSRPVPTPPVCCIPGSLGSDAGWLNGLSGAVHALNDAQSPNGRQLDDSAIRVRYAGCLDGASMGLVSVTRKGQNLIQWFGGPADALPANLSLVAQAPLANAVALTGSDSNGQGHLVVLALPGALIHVSLGVAYRADGSVQRTFTTPAVKDAMAMVSVPRSSGHPTQMRVVVTWDGQTLFDGAPTDGGWPQTLITRGITQALSGTRGPGASVDLATSWISAAVADAGVDPNTVQFSVVWAGTLHGRRTGLLKLNVPGGGTLFYAVDGEQSFGQLRTDLRQLVPADGADRRPIGWRLPAGAGTPPDAVAVLTPSGTARAEVVVGTKRTELSLDQDGFALTTVPQSGVPQIRAYDSAGELLGQSVLPIGAALDQSDEDSPNS